MTNKVIVLTENGLQAVINGLGELPAKVSHALLIDLDTQLGMAEKDLKRYVDMVEEHLAPFKSKLTVIEDKSAALAKKIADEAKQVVSHVADAV